MAGRAWLVSSVWLCTAVSARPWLPPSPPPTPACSPEALAQRLHVGLQLVHSLLQGGSRDGAARRSSAHACAGAVRAALGWQPTSTPLSRRVHACRCPDPQANPRAPTSLTQGCSPLPGVPRAPARPSPPPGPGRPACACSARSAAPPARERSRRQTAHWPPTRAAPAAAHRDSAPKRGRRCMSGHGEGR